MSPSTNFFPKKTLLWVGIFAISMAFLESSVVVYLRKLYFPENFAPPFPPMDKNIFVTELFRELGTLIMLVSASILAGRSTLEKFAFFIFSFAVWDIFYYIFLWLILSWPNSLLEWDILFLLPVPWTGPVLAPVLIALNMIALAILILKAKETHPAPIIRWKHSIYMISGCILVLITFMFKHLDFFFSPWTTNSDGLLTINLASFPESYPWIIFGTGEGVILIGIIMYMKDYSIYSYATSKIERKHY